MLNIHITDTYRENAPSYKTLVHAKSMCKDIWVVVTLNQLFIRGSYIGIKLSKK